MKKILAIILTTIVVMSFSACSKNNKNETSSGGNTGITNSKNNSKNSSKSDSKVDKSGYITQTKDAKKSTEKEALTKTIVIKDETYTIKIFGSSQYCATQIEIYNSKDTVNPMQIFAFTGTNAMLTLGYGFSCADINFDGNTDFRIISSDGQDALGTIKYQNYVWDKDLQKFYNATVLDKIPNIKIDAAQKVLTFKKMETAFTGSTGKLQFIDDVFVLVTETSQVMDAATNKFKLTTRALKDGKLQTVSETQSDTSIFKE